MELGVNYKATEANWASDIIDLQNAGVTCIRIHMAALPSTWNSGGNTNTPGTYAYWRRMADHFHSAGFWVTWGPSGLNGMTAGTMTATNWIQYHDSVVAEATYMQANGYVVDEFELGNEMESQCDGTTLTVDQFQINMGVLATDVKAVYSLATKIGYSPWDFANTTYDKWITNGLGGLDNVNVHPYSNIGTGGRGLVYGGYTACLKMIKHFGSDACYVTEFGLEGNDTNLNSMSTDVQISMMKDRWNFLKNCGFKKAMLYTYVGYLNTDDQFAMKWNDGHYQRMWDVVVGDGKRTKYVNK